MIVRSFVAWSETACASQKALATAALARAYLHSELGDSERGDAEIAMTSILDDGSAVVRRALAEALADSDAAPHHIIVALANDQSDIALPVLRRSPVLTQGDLIDCAAVGDTFAQSAIALRWDLSAPVCAALAEIGGREALIALAVNSDARIAEASLTRMLERFGHDGEMREAILSRRNLSPCLRARIVDATVRSLSAFVTGCDWMSEERAARAGREAREKAVVIIASDLEDRANDIRDLVSYLRGASQLTGALVLRSLLSSDCRLLEAALVELSGFSAARVAGLVRTRRGAGFRALFTRAGLPDWLFAPVNAALATMEELGDRGSANRDGGLHRGLIEPVLAACQGLADQGLANQGLADHELAPVIAMLRRFQAEAAREEARIATRHFLTPVMIAPQPVRPRVDIDLDAIEAEILRDAA
jgi:uncharacterized protein (DUF2336 family)